MKDREIQKNRYREAERRDKLIGERKTETASEERWRGS